jgi:hypothetical protein
MKIQGSTQIPASVPQTEMDAVQRASKKDKADAANGPASSTNNNERHAPEVQPRNPASERKFEGQAVAADLNAKLDKSDNRTRIVHLEEVVVYSVKGSEPKPQSNNIQEMELVVIESLKHDDLKKES